MKYSPEQIDLFARHAAERAKLLAEQENARQELDERQRAEAAEAGIALPAPPQPGRKAP